MNSNCTLFRALVVAVLVSASFATYAERGTLHLDGIVQIRGDASSSARVVVLPSEGASYALNNVSGRFTLKLPLDGIYLLSFEREGLVTKQIYFDTSVPVEKHSTQQSFPFKVTLSDVGRDNVFAYAGPVGIVHYEASKEDFDYRTDHSLAPGAPMADRINSLMARMEVRGADGLPKGMELTYKARSAPSVAYNAEAERTAHAAEEHLFLPMDTGIQIPEPSSGNLLASASTPEPKESTAYDLRPSLAEQNARTSDVHNAARTWAGEELITERNHVITVVRLVEPTGHRSEYRRVVHRHGLVVHFHDGVQIPERIYRQATGR